MFLLVGVAEIMNELLRSYTLDEKFDDVAYDHRAYDDIYDTTLWHQSFGLCMSEFVMAAMPFLAAIFVSYLVV